MVQYLSLELKEAEPVISTDTFIRGFRHGLPYYCHGMKQNDLSIFHNVCLLLIFGKGRTHDMDRVEGTLMAILD